MLYYTQIEVVKEEAGIDEEVVLTPFQLGLMERNKLETTIHHSEVELEDMTRILTKEQYEDIVSKSVIKYSTETNEDRIKIEDEIFNLPKKLTPIQFSWMIARYEYDDVIDHVLAAAKQTGLRELYATFYKDIKNAKNYRLDKTIEAFTIATQYGLTPEGFLLNKEELGQHWKEAEEV